MKKNLLKKAGMLMASVSVLSMVSMTAFAADTETDAGEAETVEESVEGETVEGETAAADSESTDEVSDTSTETTEAALEASDPLNLEYNTVSSNVFFNGSSLSGLSYDDALDTVETPLKRIEDMTFTVQSPTNEDYRLECSYLDLGISWDDSAVEQTLTDSILTGTLLDRYKKAKDYQAAPMDVDVNLDYSLYDMISYFEDQTTEWNTDPVNAQVTVEYGNINVVPSVTGYTFDFTGGVQELVKSLKALDFDDSGEFFIDDGETATYPDFTTERANSLSVIGSFYTSYDAPSTPVLANRQNNLIVSTGNMNGTVIQPGEIGSALAMYGDVSLAGGYREAGTIMNGQHVDSVGGGICQTTTTLYNAVLMAELEVTYRSNHSMLVTYVEPSRDAMVFAAGGKDFTFRNDTDEILIVNSYVDTSNCTIHVNLIGKEVHAPDHQVRYVSQILGASAPSLNLVPDASLPIGFSMRSKYHLADSNNSPLPAMQSRLYKITTDNGVDSEPQIVNNYDSYKAQPVNMVVAPDTVVTCNVTGDRAAAYISYNVNFLDGTPVGSNPASWSDAQIESFNATMSAQMASRGFSWPDSGNGYSIDGKEVKPNTTSAPEGEGEGEGDGGSEGEGESEGDSTESAE